MLLVCAVLKTLHVKSFITKEECRRIDNAGKLWEDELARTIAVKPPGVVELVMDVLEEYNGEMWYSRTPDRIKSEHSVLHWNSM